MTMCTGFRVVSSAALGVAAAMLLACGSSGAGLIPVENAGPLQSDFETVAQAAENAGGSCVATEAAILKTERDFSSLPATVDAGLRNRLEEGIRKLHSDAVQLCKQPLAQTTATQNSPKTTTSTKTTTPATTPTVTQTTTTTTTPTTPPAPSGPGGGTPAPGGGAEASPGAGSEAGGGNGAGEAAPRTGATGQEAGK